MAKFEEVFPDVQEIFDTVIDITELERFIDFKVIANNKLKEICKVAKTNDVTKYLGGVDVVIIVNQLIFDQLPTSMQEMVAIEALTYVHFDDEKDKVTIKKPDVSTFSGVLKKYGYDEYEKLQESIKSLYDKKNNDGEEEPVVVMGEVGNKV